MASIGKVGVLSIGEMGLGVARLLASSSVPVLTTLQDRSPATRERAESAGVKAVDTDAIFVSESDVILSIVPPRYAETTAERIASAYDRQSAKSRDSPLYYLDLNAVSPRSAKAISGILNPSSETNTTEQIRYLDGGIIGPPPKQGEDGSWLKPSIVISGDHEISPDLCSILNIKHVSKEIGEASGLKMCFASLTKGLTSIAIQSYSTAHRLGVLDELRSHLATYSPQTKALADRSLVGMQTKAHRWVAEMQEISETFRDEGGFDLDMFLEVAKVYDFVANRTSLGEEGGQEKNTEDVARAIGAAMKSDAEINNRQ